MTDTNTELMTRAEWEATLPVPDVAPTGTDLVVADRPKEWQTRQIDGGDVLCWNDKTNAVFRCHPDDVDHLIANDGVSPDR